MIQMFGFRVTEWCLGHSSGKVKKNKFITKKKNLAIRLGLLSSEDFQVEAVDSTGSGGG